MDPPTPAPKPSAAVAAEDSASTSKEATTEAAKEATPEAPSPAAVSKEEQPSAEPPASADTATSEAAAGHFSAARTPRHCNRAATPGDKKAKGLHVAIPGEEGSRPPNNQAPSEAPVPSGGGDNIPAPAGGGAAGPAGGTPHPGRHARPRPPPSHHPRYEGYPPPHYEGSPPYDPYRDPRYGPRYSDARYHPDPRYDPRYTYAPDPYYEPRGRRGYYDHPYEPPHHYYYPREGRHEEYPRESARESSGGAGTAAQDTEAAPNDAEGNAGPRTSAGGQDHGSLRAVSSSFSDGKSLTSGEAAKEGGAAVTAGAKVAAKSPGVVTRGGSSVGSEGDKESNGEPPIPSQPSLRSSRDDDDEVRSDASWRQLNQVASVDRSELLRLTACRSELTAPGGAKEDDGKGEGAKGEAEEAKDSKASLEVATKEGGEAKDTEGGEPSPAELQQVPSGLSRTSSLSQSPTETEAVYPPEPHGYPARHHAPPPHPYYHPHHLPPGARPPPPHYYGHGPRRYPPHPGPPGAEDDHSPSASTISTKASLAGPHFFGRGHHPPPTPSMKPKHPFLKKARDDGPAAKRRKLSEGSDAKDGADDDRPHVALDGRAMARSPVGDLADISAVPSWETAGRPLAGWSVCSGMTGDAALGTAFSFTEGFRNEGESGGGGNGAHGEEGEGEDDPSPKSILSKVGEKRKARAPGTHVQFSRESKRGAPLPPPPDDYDCYYDRHGPAAYEGCHRPPPRSYYEEDPYGDAHYGYHPSPAPYCHPPPPRHAARGYGRYDEPPPRTRASGGRPVHAPPSPEPRASMPRPGRAPSQFSHPRPDARSGDRASAPARTPADDAALADATKQHQAPRKWDPVADKLGRGKSAPDGRERWTRHPKPGARKGQWTAEEDRIVSDAVREASSRDEPFARWSDLASRLPGRAGKQVRDRWVNHLNPALNHLPFGRADDLALWEGHRRLGKRWVEISARCFGGSRSENHIKNRWYSASFKKFVAKEFGEEAYAEACAGRAKELRDRAAAEAPARAAGHGPPIVSGHGINHM